MSFTTKMTLIASLFQRVYDSSFVLLIFFVHGMSIFLSYLSNNWYFFLGFNVDLISNDDSSGPCRHISGPNRPRDLQSINSREPWDSSRNRWILKVFPGSTIAMVGSWMKCQKFVISKCIYIRRFINTSDQVISIVQARYFILWFNTSTGVESCNAIIEYTLLCWIFFNLHCGLDFLFSWLFYSRIFQWFSHDFPNKLFTLLIILWY